MRHIIDAIAAQGRDGDSELLHVTKGELAGLDGLARKVYGRSLPRNPRTGLKEASLFRDWFGNDVGMALDVAAPVALGFTGVGAPAAIAMGAGLGAANQGLGKGGTTESALMGGVMGGMGAYGGSGLAEGLTGAGASAAPTTGGLTATPTPIGGALPGAETISTALPGTETIATALPGADTVALADTNLLAQQAGGTGLTMPTGGSTTGLKLGTDTAGSTNVLNSATNTSTGGGAGLQVPEGGVKSLGGEAGGTNWNYLTTKDAASNAVPILTSAAGAAGIPGAPTDTTSTVPGVNKTLPKAEVYYTPYGERRTRIAAAEGGLMGFADYDAADAEKDGGYAPGGIAGYAGGGEVPAYGWGGFVESIQPGGKWGDLTAEAYGSMDKALPFMKDITPGGAVGELQPGRRDWERKQTEEEQRKKAEQEAGIAAALKAKQQQEFTDKWTDRYSAPVQGMAEGGYMGPRDGEAISAIVRASQPKEENAFEHPAIRKIAGQNVTKSDFDAWNSARQEPNAFEHPMIRRMAGQNITQDDLTSWNNRQRGYANGGGIANIAAAKGRYLQGPGDGMSDSIPANIDGKQEARLATGEYVLPADIVSHLGNGDSTAGAKQIDGMMERIRHARTGNKKQGKQINPRKYLPA